MSFIIYNKNLRRKMASANFKNGIGIYLYRTIRYGVVAYVTYLYLDCFAWDNYVFEVLMGLLFAYSFMTVANMLIHFFIYFLSKPRLLAERKDVIENGIPNDINVMFFRPIFGKTNPEMDTHLDNMRQDILNSLEPQASMRFLIVDNTRDPKVREYTKQRIRNLQAEFGADKVFYFHRNVKCDFFKKVGIYEDSIMLLHDGWTRPKHYISEKWQPFTKGLRNPGEPLFDDILGDISGLGIRGTVEDITKGREVSIDPKKRISIAIVQDADNIWPKGAVRKLVAKMAHPDNKDYTIYQPSIDISNPNDNKFINMAFIARQMYGFDPIAKWRVFNFSPFYGKGAMAVENYVRDIILKEPLHPAKAASHDFQEALHTWSVLLEDVYIWERTFSNKLAELTRTALWGWGDLETVKQFLLKPFQAGRKAHLFVLLRNVIGTFMYDLWLIGSVIGFMMPSLSSVAKPSLLVCLFASIVLINILLPKLLVPILYKFYKKPYELPLPLLHQKNIFAIIATVIYETAIAVLVHSLDLVYKPIGFFKNFTSQFMGVSFVWKTGAMSEIETQGATILTNYKALKLAVSIGAALAVLSIVRFFPGHVALFLSPYMASFLLGPYAIWLTAKPFKDSV